MNCIWGVSAEQYVISTVLRHREIVVKLNVQLMFKHKSLRWGELSRSRDCPIFVNPERYRHILLFCKLWNSNNGSWPTESTITKKHNIHVLVPYVGIIVIFCGQWIVCRSSDFHCRSSLVRILFYRPGEETHLQTNQLTEESQLLLIPIN